MNVDTYLCYFIEMRAWAIDKCLHLSINEIHIFKVSYPFYTYFEGFFRGLIYL